MLYIYMNFLGDPYILQNSMKQLQFLFANRTILNIFSKIHLQFGEKRLNVQAQFSRITNHGRNTSKEQLRIENEEVTSAQDHNLLACNVPKGEVDPHQELAFQLLELRRELDETRPKNMTLQSQSSSIAPKGQVTNLMGRTGPQHVVLESTQDENATEVNPSPSSKGPNNEQLLQERESWEARF